MPVRGLRRPRKPRALARKTVVLRGTIPGLTSIACLPQPGIDLARRRPACMTLAAAAGTCRGRQAWYGSCTFADGHMALRPPGQGRPSQSGAHTHHHNAAQRQHPALAQHIRALDLQLHRHLQPRALRAAPPPAGSRVRRRGARWSRGVPHPGRARADARAKEGEERRAGNLTPDVLQSLDRLSTRRGCGGAAADDARSHVDW
ncbi:hypothetical protein EVG20_g9897 [Dentipellis fragilis]|uniref:Uncharacterized protein n=1 Tax=Dentipellis fragilis TaxID=205917 RepID=A0A4Y9XZD6_9AGAM|nr:hypothetical protein EVG20_g9897 [Dentipellis fragilis]